MKKLLIVSRLREYLSIVLVTAILGGLIYCVCDSIYTWYAHRNEPVYLISRAHDPVFKSWGFVPDIYTCSSPVRCEPSGEPSFQYLTMLKEHEVRKWGLDPSKEIPFEEK